ncbi:TetR/AcrR family transcriptional regulator [Conexibacter woesei]|uniref:Transcriptional regulator, TetR family n=1 Tax=Conexibacter woesei (strain DSM 14684 / CCUG 47730 / CIP 108061 / JCM 11494 / NBRC 100937 / ID131577) TaxID=469383 RepID=D3FC54_CONWI|nr:TetR/AcrR family transcriptional regulator [Conexibacter woesei]ADB53349.1 transcriptional regulator, TetR family [Conexibacter woesei DSM 14684]
MASVLSTEERIRRTAMSLFAARGYAATGIREMAEAAGVQTASLYHYMGTKEDLLRSLMLDGNRRLLGCAQLVVEEDAPPEQRLAALVQVHVLSHAHQREEAVVLDTELKSLGEEARAEVVAVRDRYEGLWRSAIEEGAADGVFTLENPSATRLGLIAMCTGVAHWYSPRRGDDDALALAFADTALGAVRARRDGADVRASSPGMPQPAAVRDVLVSLGIDVSG